MSSTFPTTLQDLDATRGTTGQPLSTPDHITHHTLEDDTIEALQTKLGVDSSAVATSIDYKLKNASSINPGHLHTMLSGISDVAITSPATGNGLFYNEVTAKWENSNVNVPDATTTVAGVVEEATDAELAAGTAAGGAARLFANGGSFTQTPTASKVPVALATGLLADGWLGLTTAGDLLYSDGSVLTRLALGTSGYFLTAGASAPTWTQYANLAEANTVFGNTDITGAELQELSGGAATSLHTHAVLGWKNGTITRDVSAADGAVTTAHGLGRTPIFVRITGLMAGKDSVGVYNGTTTSCVWSYGDPNDGNDDSNIIHYSDGTNSATATIGVDATNITLTWTKANSPMGTFHILWEAY